MEACNIGRIRARPSGRQLTESARRISYTEISASTNRFRNANLSVNGYVFETLGLRVAQRELCCPVHARAKRRRFSLSAAETTLERIPAASAGAVTSQQWRWISLRTNRAVMPDLTKEVRSAINVTTYEEPRISTGGRAHEICPAQPTGSAR
jgi:hypothetical protein